MSFFSILILLLSLFFSISNAISPLFQSICPPGTEPTSQTAIKPECRSCSKNQFSSILTNFECMKCPPGTFTFGKGNEFCLRKGSKKCPPPYWLDNQGACKQCGTKSRYDLKSKSCIPCGKDRYSHGGDATTCFTCGPEQTYIEDAVRCACPAGRVRVGKSCILCPPGRYRRDMMDLEFCYQCPQGTYTKNFGSKSCEKCKKGFSTPWKGAISCLRKKDADMILKYSPEMTSTHHGSDIAHGIHGH